MSLEIMAQGTGGSSGSIGAVSQQGVWNVGINGGSVTALQSAPFIVSGLSVSVSGSNSVTALQSAPYIVSGLSVTGSASVTALQSNVYLTSGTQSVTQSGNWNVGINGGSVSVRQPDIFLTSGTQAVTQSGNWNVGIVGGGITALQSTPFLNSGVEVTVDKSTFTEGVGKGVPMMGVYRENTTGDLTEGQAGVARLTSKRGQHINLRNASGVEIGTSALPLVSSPQAATSGGWNSFSVIAQSTVSGLNIKSTAGQVGGWALFNIAATPAYLKVYNTSAAPVVGTTIPQLRLLIPGNTAGGGANVEVANGIIFTTGIGMGVTTGITDGDATLPTSNQVIVNLLYK